MKILSQVDKKFHKYIKKNAKLVGLDLIGPEEYRLYKVGTKADPDAPFENEYIDRGKILIVGDDKYVWIAILNRDTWYKTSAVLKCTKYKYGFELETQNSIYHLEAREKESSKKSSS